MTSAAIWAVLAPRRLRVSELQSVPWRAVFHFLLRVILPLLLFPVFTIAVGIFAVLVLRKPVFLLKFCTIIGFFVAILLLVFVTSSYILSLIRAQRDLDELSQQDRDQLDGLNADEFKAAYQRIKWQHTMERWGTVVPDWKTRGPEFAVELRARNRWIDWLSVLSGLLGLISPFALFGKDINTVGWPALGIEFGGLAFFPLIFICLVTLPFGLQRHMEFWFYYEIRHGGLSRAWVCLAPCLVIGLASVIALAARVW